MQVDDLSSLDPNVDFTQILPIQQKRTVAFINHFIMNTVSFLNQFAQSCESRLMDIEYKIEKVEASLLILESQLSSISGLDNDTNAEVSLMNNLKVDGEKEEEAVETDLVAPIDLLPEIQEEQTANHTLIDGPLVCEDPRFQRFFKMVQFGVPMAAVKLKMQTEGLDPDLLDTPNAIIAGFKTANEEEEEVVVPM